jgi:hypothetical protein
LQPDAHSCTTALRRALEATSPPPVPPDRLVRGSLRASALADGSRGWTWRGRGVESGPWQSSTTAPLAELMLDAAAEIEYPATRNDIVAWFAERYPKVKASTVRGHVVGLTENDSSRHHYRWLASRDPLFTREPDGTLRRTTRNLPMTAIRAMVLRHSSSRSRHSSRSSWSATGTGSTGGVHSNSGSRTRAKPVISSQRPSDDWISYAATQPRTRWL